MAKNGAKGSGRIGNLMDQIKAPSVGSWTKRNPSLGRFKKTKSKKKAPFKGVIREN